MKRGLAAAAAVIAVALAAVVAAVLLAPVPAGPPGPEPGRSLYQLHCATCHGADGRGRTWRARLLFLEPGDLTAPAVAALPDQYLADIIRHGGANFGKPGMPSFGFALGDAEIRALVAYVRTLSGPGPRADAIIPAIGRRPAAKEVPMVRGLVLCAVPGLGEGATAAGEPVRGLTPGEIEALRDGHGMELARAAELNRYPGPRHGLDAAGAGERER